MSAQHQLETWTEQEYWEYEKKSEDLEMIEDWVEMQMARASEDD